MVSKVDHSVAAWKTWVSNGINSVASKVSHSHKAVNTVHLTFTDSFAKGLNSQLKNTIEDRFAQATKAILFNAATITGLASVALYAIGSMSFFNTAATVALSLLGRSIVIQSFDPNIVELSVPEDSAASYMIEPDVLFALGGYQVFTKMEPIIEVFQKRVPGQGSYLGFSVRIGQ